MSKIYDSTNEELPLEENFIEQAEYINEEKFLELAAEHPEEDAILRKLMGGGAKLLIGPRGCGKSTLLLKSFHCMTSQNPVQSFPIYVNFKLSLKLEPLYTKGPNASYWFKRWLVLKVISGAIKTLDSNSQFVRPSILPSNTVISRMINKLEAGDTNEIDLQVYNVEFLSNILEAVVNESAVSRCVVLIDDAAHAFSEKQQEDFFDFFRALKSRVVSPKAAVYPGVTSHSPSFHVGHDAEQIDVWMRPSGPSYEEFMLSLATKRLDKATGDIVLNNSEDIRFLAHAAFGIPRAFLGMLRAIYNAPDSYATSDGKLNKRKVLELSRNGRDMSHAVYLSLEAKLPSYRSYVQNGARVYQAILANMKSFNAGKDLKDQALQFGIRTPVDPNIQKVIGFLQYAGLLMPAGDVMRGVNGTFSVYHVHLGDLVAENTIVGRRTKSISQFLEVTRATKHQAWPRFHSGSIMEAAGLTSSSFFLSLPQCHACGTERSSPDARFCSNCGAQLRASSTYEALVQQDISVLPISSRLQKRIIENSKIRKVRDILIDTSREQLRGIKYIGETRARVVVSAAEEYVS